MGEGDERRLKGEERGDEEQREERWYCGTNGHQTRDLCLRLRRWSCVSTHTFCLGAVTYGPHVDQASAQERVQVPVYTGQAGDVEDFMAQACRDQEEEVQ